MLNVVSYSTKHESIIKMNVKVDNDSRRKHHLHCHGIMFVQQINPYFGQIWIILYIILLNEREDLPLNANSSMCVDAPHHYNIFF